MKLHQSFLTAVAVGALVACGGGGGGSTSTATPPIAVTPVVPPVATTPQVAITANNAKAVGSAALDAVGNPLAMLGTAAALDTLSRNLTPSVFTQTQACPNGGSVVMGSNLTDPRLISSGDRFSASFSNCGVAQAAGIVISMTGSVTSTVTFFTAVRDQFQSTMEALGTNFLNRSYEFSGTQILVLERNGQSYIGHSISGPSTKVKVSNGALVRNNVWKDYMQSAVYGTGTTSYTMSATIQTDNTNVAAATSGFVVNTIAPVVRNDVTGLLASGAISVVGAANSRLNVTVNPNGSATIQIDANGDGVFETTVTSTAAELAALL